MKGKSGTAGIFLALLMLSSLMCFSPQNAAAATRVAVTIFPLAAIAEEVGGEKVDITTIVPFGSDPHHFELTPAQARAVHEANVIFLIGGHFDEWILSSETVGSETCLVVELHQAFKDSLLPVGHSFNPHFWLDPLYAKEIARIAKMALCTVDLSNCDFYAERASAFMAELDRVTATSRARLEKTGFTDYVALHPAWTYFARRFGIRERATIEVSHHAEPSVKHITAVINQMKQEGIAFIVAEEFATIGLAESVASESGAQIIILDPLGGEDVPGRDSYSGLIDYNIGIIESRTGASGEGGRGSAGEGTGGSGGQE
jgi:ABC-type Zn uptake system ZnuABC Zn-binding protein ZnuA